MLHERFEHQNAANTMGNERFEFKHVANTVEMAASSSKCCLNRMENGQNWKFFGKTFVFPKEFRKLFGDSAESGLLSHDISTQHGFKTPPIFTGV